MGQVGARRVKRWLEATARFRITHEVYDIPVTGEPPTQLRVPQLNGKNERFDLFGHLVAEDGKAGRSLFVECKQYSNAGNQGPLYSDYLATCYSAFATMYRDYSSVPSVEFMWATTHPFALGKFTKLTSADEIVNACRDNRFLGRLNGEPIDDDLVDALAERLWLAILNSRVEEMMMSRQMLAHVTAHIVETVG